MKMATWTQRTHLLLRSILFQLRASLWTLGWLWGRHLGLLGRATAEPERRKSFAKAASRNGFYCTANSQGKHGRNKITWLLSTNYRVTPCSTHTDLGQVLSKSHHLPVPDSGESLRLRERTVPGYEANLRTRLHCTVLEELHNHTHLF